MNRELLRWQIDEIRKGIEEADRSEFASEHDVQKILKKWNSKVCEEKIGRKPKQSSTR